MRPSPESFQFTKWYLDGVSNAGQVLVGYWTELRWRGLHLNWHSIAQSDATGSLKEQTSLSPTGPPVWGHRVLSWTAPAFGLALEYHPLAIPYSIPLHASAEGSVQWHCETPAGRVTATRRGRAPLEMLGYAERIHFTIPPWRLPVRELRWGRWIADSGERGLVWNDWRGEGRPRTWVLLDGHEMEGARVLDQGVTAPRLALKLIEPREIRSRVLSDLVGNVPGLAHLLPDTILALRETRWVGRGELLQQSGPSIWGTVLFEHVIMG